MSSLREQAFALERLPRGGSEAWEIPLQATEFFPVGTPSGTVAVTLGSTTSSATGSVQPVATLAKTLGDATSAITLGVNPPSLPMSWMPQIALGKPIYGSGSVSKLIDGGYFYDTVTPGAWACAANDYAAINLGAGPKKILVAIGSDQAIITAGQYVNAAAFEAYRFQVSNNSTNGVDGTWTTVVTVTGNTFTTREHLIDFTGYSWVKLIMDTVTGGRIDELDVWDASGGTENTFAFVGDSLTVRGTSREYFLGGGKLPSFQQDFETNRGFYPLMVSLGVTGRDAAGLASDISTMLSTYPDVKYWLIGMGTNNGAGMPSQLATFISSMTTTINAIVAAGRVPILGRVPYTDAAGYGGNTSPLPALNGLKYLNDNGINALVASLGVRPGADLFQPFYDNRTAWAVLGDPHFNDDGVRGWADLWAKNIGLTGAGGVVFPTLGDATSAATGSFSNTATGTVAQTLGDATCYAYGGPPTANLAVTLADATVAASGAVIISVTGTLAVTLANASAAAVGTRSAALRMDAVADSLKLGTVPTSSTNYTALGWAKIRTDRNNYSGIFVLENSGASQFQELMTDVNGTTLMVFDHVGLALTVGTMVVNTYHKVAISVSGTTVSAYFGTMGTPGLTKVTGTIAAVTTLATFGIGSSSVSEWFNGLFEGVRVYNAVLSDFEVQLEFTSPVAVRTSNLLVDTLPPGITAGNELVSLTGSNLVQFIGGTPAYTLEGGPLLDTLVGGTVAKTLGDATCAASGSFTSGSSSYTAAISETVTLSESLASHGVFHSTLTETVSLSDSISAVKRALAALSETVALSDSIAALKRAQAAVSETVTLSDALTSHGVFKSTLTDTVTLSDSLAALKRVLAALPETVTLSDALTSHGVFKSTLPETVALSEALAALKRANPLLAETVTLSDSAVALKRSQLSLAETITLSDSLVALKRATASLSETISLSDSLAAIKRATAALAETLTLTEAVAEFFSGGAAHYTASLSETVSLAESLAAHVAFHTAVTDTVALSEALVGRLHLVAPVSDTVTLAESLVAKLAAHPTLSETVTLSESLLAVLKAKVALAESEALSDSITALKRTTAPLSDTVTVSDSLAAVKRSTAALADSVTLGAGTLTAVKRAIASLTDTVALSETQGSRAVMHEALADTLALADSIAVNVTSTGHYSASLAETVALAESIVAKLVTRGTVSETVILGAGTLAVAKKATVPLPDSVAFSDTLASRFTGRQALADSVAVSEAMAALKRATVPLAESLSLAESLASKLRNIVALADTATLTESLSATKRGQALLSESLSLTESLFAQRRIPISLSDTLALTESLATNYKTTVAFLETLSLGESLFANVGARNYVAALSETVALLESLQADYRFYSPLPGTGAADNSILPPLGATATVDVATVPLAPPTGGASQPVLGPPMPKGTTYTS